MTSDEPEKRRKQAEDIWPNSSLLLGIEIGGTKLQLGLGRGEGRIMALERRAVEPAGGSAAIRRQIEAAAVELLGRVGVEWESVAGIGIGFGGPVDVVAGTVCRSHQIGGWEGFPLAAWAAQTLGRPAVVENDADAAGLAEARFGGGRGLSPVFYVTVGTGVGGSLVVGGRIYRGGGPGAAEIGHLRVWPEAADQPAGPWLSLESLVSGWSIARRARTALAAGAGPGSSLAAASPESITAETVAAAAHAGDELARRILSETCRALGIALAHVVTLLGPRRIIIGGGVSSIGEALFFEPIRQVVAESAFPLFTPFVEIVPAALGAEVVVQGALAVAADRFLCGLPRAV